MLEFLLIFNLILNVINLFICLSNLKQSEAIFENVLDLEKSIRRFNRRSRGNK